MASLRFFLASSPIVPRHESIRLAALKSIVEVTGLTVEEFAKLL